MINTEADSIRNINLYCALNKKYVSINNPENVKIVNGSNLIFLPANKSIIAGNTASG